jgi:hypothetical protein
MSKTENHVEPIPTEDNASGCLIRLVWMLLGNIIWAVSAISIAMHSSSLSVADAIFWATVAGLIGVRHIDIARFGGQTASGQPATLSHWRRYAIMLVVLSFAVWIVVHAIAWKGANT